MPKDVKVRTCLWFEKDGLSAARFYVGLMSNSALETDPAEGTEPVIDAFTLGGVPFQSRPRPPP
jgi:predicted 3-demethylubiquinone-9 3-methyltransferase (glyoxalase superfamily)